MHRYQQSSLQDELYRLQQNFKLYQHQPQSSREAFQTELQVFASRFSLQTWSLPRIDNPLDLLRLEFVQAVCQAARDFRPALQFINQGIKYLDCSQADIKPLLKSRQVHKLFKIKESELRIILTSLSQKLLGRSEQSIYEAVGLPEQLDQRLKALSFYSNTEWNVFSQDSIKTTIPRILKELEHSQKVSRLINAGQFREVSHQLKTVNPCLQRQLVLRVQHNYKEQARLVRNLQGTNSFQQFAVQVNKLKQFSVIEAVLQQDLNQQVKEIEQGLKERFLKQLGKYREQARELDYSQLGRRILHVKALHNCLKQIGAKDLAQFNADEEINKVVFEQQMGVIDLVDKFGRPVLEQNSKLTAKFTEHLKWKIEKELQGVKNRMLREKLGREQLREVYLHFRQLEFRLQYQCLADKLEKQLANIREVLAKVESYYKISIPFTDKLTPQYFEYFRLFRSYAELESEVLELRNSYQKVSKELENLLSEERYAELIGKLEPLTKFDRVKDILCVDQAREPNRLWESLVNDLKDAAESKLKSVRTILMTNEIDESKTALLRADLLFFDKIFEKRSKLIHKFEGFVDKINEEILRRLQRQIPVLDQRNTVSFIESANEISKRNKDLLQVLRQFLCRVTHVARQEEVVRIDEAIKPFDEIIGRTSRMVGKVQEEILDMFRRKQFKETAKYLQTLKGSQDKMVSEQFLEARERIVFAIKEGQKACEKMIQGHNLDELKTKLEELAECQEDLGFMLQMESSVCQKLSTSLLDKIRKLHMEKGLRGIEDNKLKLVCETMQVVWSYVQKFPRLEGGLRQMLAELIGKLQHKNLIAQFSVEIERTKLEAGELERALYGQLIHLFEKELQIQRILPNIRMGFDEAVSRFKGQHFQDKDRKEALRKSYELYRTTYDQLKEVYLEKGILDEMSQNLAKSVQFIKGVEERRLAEELPRIIAHLFIYWVLARSGKYYFNMRRIRQEGVQISEPHPIQVISLLVFLGCDTPSGFIQWLTTRRINLTNHFMQISTGEGKSIILGILSVVFSLLGYETYCVCYSEYLSTRDFESFRDLFETFGTRVHYSTFAELAQKLLKEQCDISATVAGLFDGKQAKAKWRDLNFDKKILIVDQVDTFGKQFYGQTINPNILFCNEEVQALFALIWSNRSNSPAEITRLYSQSQPFKRLARTMADCLPQLKYALQSVVQEATKFDPGKRDNKLEGRQVKYKQQDGYSGKVNFGYETMILYQHECERNQWSRAQLKGKVGIVLTCGRYSYAEIIRQFKFIFGVTGTFNQSCKLEKAILQLYNVQNISIAPSVYGLSNLTNLDLDLEADEALKFIKLSKFLQTSRRDQKAALVFFRDWPELKRFNDSEYGSRFQRMQVVSQRTDKETRDLLIRRATEKCAITLFTAIFGRGTDFVVFDDERKQNDRVVVVQTFFSQDQSEELQIKGRTARQGAKGSYKLFLSSQQLRKQYSLQEDLVGKEIGEIKRQLIQIRNENSSNQYHKKQQEYRQAKVTHKSSMQFLRAVMEGRVSRSNSKFYEAERKGQSHLLIMIDSTGSMGETLNQVKDKVLDMIDGLSQQHQGAFKVQLFFYYGKDHYEKGSKLTRSEWTSSKEELSRFMENIEPDGGCHNQAVPMAVFYMLHELKNKRIDAAMLIGDDYYRDRQFHFKIHPDDWALFQNQKDIKFVLQEQLVKLKQHNVKINTYPILDQSKREDCQKTLAQFKGIADATNGQCKKFNPAIDSLSAEVQSRIEQCLKLRSIN